MKNAACRALCVLLLAIPALADPRPQGSPRRSGCARAKTLFFDRKYTEAREAWREVLVQAHGHARPTPPPTGSPAAARAWASSERAFKEYGEFLGPASGRPRAGRGGAHQPRRPGGAAREGRAASSTWPRCSEAPADPSRTVRYYAALQARRPGPECGRRGRDPARDRGRREGRGPRASAPSWGCCAAIPRRPRCATGTAAPAPPRRRAPPRARWIKVRIFEKGSQRAQGVPVNVPLALAELVFKSLPDDARQRAAAEGLRRRQLLGAAAPAAARPRSSRSRATTASASRSGSSRGQRCPRASAPGGALKAPKGRFGGGSGL